MFPLKVAGFVPPAVAFAVALALTPLVRALARRLGFVAKPKTDRWHKKPTAMLGGLSIWLAVIITYLLFLPHNPHPRIKIRHPAPKRRQLPLHIIHLHLPLFTLLPTIPLILPTPAPLGSPSLPLHRTIRMVQTLTMVETTLDLIDCA